MKKISGIILPIAYFPPVSYFSWLVSGYPVLIETGETYPKQTIRNRCEIGSSHGRQNLVVPVAKPFGNHTKTYEILISSHEDWRKKHWRALETAYSSTPFFIYYSDKIKELVFGEYDSLALLDLTILKKMLEILGFEPGLDYSKGYLKETGDLLDLRKWFTRNKDGAVLKEYPQLFMEKTGFIGDLSILDLLFNAGPESHSYLLESRVNLP